MYMANKEMCNVLYKLWPSWSKLVAVMVCGRHGQFVAVIVEPLNK